MGSYEEESAPCHQKGSSNRRGKGLVLFYMFCNSTYQTPLHSKRVGIYPVVCLFKRIQNKHGNANRRINQRVPS